MNVVVERFALSRSQRDALRAHERRDGRLISIFSLLAAALLGVSLLTTPQNFEPVLGWMFVALLVVFPVVLRLLSTRDTEYTRVSGHLAPTWYGGGDDPSGWMIHGLVLPDSVDAFGLGAIEYAHRSHVLLAVFDREGGVLWTRRGYVPAQTDVRGAGAAVSA